MLKPFSLQQRLQQGIALVEVLIAILIFSIGILALVGMQSTMAKNVTVSKLRGEASFLANQLIGQMWVDQGNLNAYTVDGNTCTEASNTRCTTWTAAVRNLLPNGAADVTVSGSEVKIALSWQLPGEMPARFEIDANVTSAE
ncbi:type IV pilus assembly protein PilV [Paucimonas lemoignei]|uniref:Type IV pilus assembly protein PilV n=1 Tax=Paucimonas lemoignei TaxID=29443 RepID=A0A4V2UIK0_PAULE|nr:prepilin-type N-terminal cleavage/methylation domain-containing protein [Paucimonas lemoignei]TCS36480.1 type IV pilus assembly protein PilV [Paucimonas lemoignei]